MPRRFVLSFVSGFAIGIFLGEFFSYTIILLPLSVSLVSLAWSRRGVIVVLGLVGMAVGVWRIDAVEAEYERLATQLVFVEEISGLIVRAWSVDGRQTFDVKIFDQAGRLTDDGVRVSRDVDGYIKAGDEVQVRCRFQNIRSGQPQRLFAQGIFTECRSPDKVITIGRSRHWRAVLARIRTSLIHRVDREYHSPQSDLLAGILLGVQETMSSELRAGFRATGTSHIVALSGFNVTIIIAAASAALSALVGRRLAYWPTVGLVVLFVIMTGASASVTRAGVMSLVLLSSAQLGRSVAMARILAYTFFGMVAMNPLVLHHDLGFQLSFLATIGLVYVSGPLTEAWRRLPDIVGVRSNLASTMAAMMATEPLLLGTFGRLSLVAPFVNLFVLPFIPLIMAMGAVGLLFPLAVPVTDMLLRLVLGVISMAADWPFAQTTTPWWVAGCLAALCGYFVVRFVYDAAKKTPPNR